MKPVGVSGLEGPQVCGGGGADRQLTSGDVPRIITIVQVALGEEGGCQG